MARVKRTQAAPRRRLAVISVVSIIAIALLAYGLLGVFEYFKVTTQGQKIPSTAVVTEDVEVPSERAPDTTAEFTVPADQPRRIILDSLNVTAYIQKMGLTKENRMAAPNNIYFGGWYVGSAKPGDEGLSIINGHAGGRYEQGVFRNLGKLTAGSPIRIEMGDLSWRDFEVVSIGTYDIDTAQKMLFKDNPDIVRELHLITCDGVFDQQAQTYDKRTIVVAKRM